MLIFNVGHYRQTLMSSVNVGELIKERLVTIGKYSGTRSLVIASGLLLPILHETAVALLLLQP